MLTPSATLIGGVVLLGAFGAASGLPSTALFDKSNFGANFLKKENIFELQKAVDAGDVGGTRCISRTNGCPIFSGSLKLGSSKRQSRASL